MSSVRDLMTKIVITIDQHKTVFDAATLMSEKRISCIVIIDGKVPVGIVTERDLVRRVLAKNLSSNAKLSKVLSKPLTTIDPDSPVREAAKLMVKHRIRRLPVVRGNILIGIIVASDFTRHLSKESIPGEFLDAMTRYSPSTLTPILIVNLKGYNEVLGEKPIIFAEVAKKLCEKYRKVTILIAPPPPIFEKIAKITPSISQHIDPLEPSGITGYILPKEIMLLGGVGSLINHSERRIPCKDIEKNIELCRKYNLLSFVCAQDIEEVISIAKLNPNFIAIEPPELIGGKISVSKARPEIIKQSVDNVKRISSNTLVLCGAGIKTREDVEKAIQLGAEGILVASGVVKTVDIEGAVEELIKGLLLKTR